MPTWRLLVILSAAAPFGAMGGAWVLLALAIVVAGVLAACVDWALAADGRRIYLERHLASDKLSLGAWNPVALRLENSTARIQRVSLREQPPFSFDLDHPSLVFQVHLRPGATSQCTYHVRPPRRGDATFGDLYLRVEGPLRLVQRSFRKSGTHQSVRVYPNLRELRRYDLLARRGLDTCAAARPVRMAGASTEFERVRDYLPDDEFRHVNWKATARRGHPLVNAFQAERSQNLVIMLDSGRSMAALADPPASDEGESTPAALTKLDRALNTALLLAHVASQRGDRVALLAYADEVRAFVPPQRGHRALLATVEALYSLEAEPIEPDHARAFAFLAQRNMHRSLVVLFTDLADRETSSVLAAHVMRAARRHMVVCVTLADPNIRRPAERRPDDARSLYEKMVAQQLLEDRANLLASLSAHGVLTVDADAESLNPKLIAAYLELKQRGRI